MRIRVGIGTFWWKREAKAVHVESFYRQKLLGLVDVLKTGSAAEARGWDRKRVAVTEGPGGSERHVEGMSEPHPSSSAAMKA